MTSFSFRTDLKLLFLPALRACPSGVVDDAPVVASSASGDEPSTTNFSTFPSIYPTVNSALVVVLGRISTVTLSALDGVDFFGGVERDVVPSEVVTRLTKSRGARDVGG